VPAAAAPWKRRSPCAPGQRERSRVPAWRASAAWPRMAEHQTPWFIQQGGR
jgi:hypothetical protein